MTSAGFPCLWTEVMVLESLLKSSSVPTFCAGSKRFVVSLAQHRTCKVSLHTYAICSSDSGPVTENNDERAGKLPIYQHINNTGKLPKSGISMQKLRTDFTWTEKLKRGLFAALTERVSVKTQHSNRRQEANLFWQKSNPHVTRYFVIM